MTIHMDVFDHINMDQHLDQHMGFRQHVIRAPEAEELPGKGKVKGLQQRLTWLTCQV